MNLQKSVKLANVFGKSLVKLQYIFRIFSMVVYSLTETLNMLLASNSDDRLTRPICTVILLLTNRKENDGIPLSLFKTFLDLTMLIVSYKRL